MKKVLVPLASKSFPSHSIPLHLVRETYLRKLKTYNLLPLFVSTISEQNTIDELYGLCDGLLFAGGSDIDPILYDKSNHEKTDIAEPKRDILEIQLIKRGIADRKPILGICRGCQALAVASGGSLHQHVPDITQSEHHGVSEGGIYDDILKNTMNIQIDRDSNIFKYLNLKTCRVHCGHHQSVDDPGNEMRIVGRSPAGIAEIIEHTDQNYFCIGIQSHPEIEENGDLEKLFEAFAKSL